MNGQFSKLTCAISKRKLLLGVSALLLLLAIGLGIFIAADPYDCRIADRVTVGGLDVGGLYPWEAWTALHKAGQALQEQPLTLSLPEQTLTFAPEELRLRCSTGKLLLAAWRSGRKHPDPSIALTQGLSWKEETVLSRLDAYAAQYDTVLTQPTYHLEGTAPSLDTAAYDPSAPCQTLILNPGTPECHLDTDAVLAEIHALLDNGFTGKPLVLAHTPVPSAMPEVLDLEAIHQELTVPGKDDALDLQTYQFVNGSYGYGFDLTQARQALADTAWNQDIVLTMETSAPEILGDAVYFRDELSYCETKCNQDEKRNTNLRLVCQSLDGLILQPGEEFSYNEVIGERTAERGYKAATAYSGTRVVKDIGGGVCQGSTTLYNCVLLADLEVLNRVCHGYTVSYVPIGLDAAVNWATKTDFVFRNNWNFPIMIRAEVSDGYMRMKILGTDEKDYYIKLTSTFSKEELRIYANCYQHKYDKETDEQISKELAGRSSYMYLDTE